MSDALKRIKRGVKPRVAIYARVRYGDTEEAATDPQIRELISCVRKEYKTKPDSVYIDIGTGRDAASRAELKKLIKECRMGNVDKVVTMTVNRFGRNMADMFSVCRRLCDKGVDVYFCEEEIHSMDVNADLSETLIAMVKEGEGLDKSESIKKGIGKRIMDVDSSIYSRTCYGYMKDDKGKLRIVKEEAKIVRRIFDSYIGGAGVYAIKTSLERDHIISPSGKEKWAKRTIEKILRNEKYIGNVMIYKTYMDKSEKGGRVVNAGEHQQFQCENHHKAIISKEKYDEVQRLMSERSVKNKAEE